MSKKTAVPVAADPTDPFAHVGDPNWGKGGSYEIDPVSGQRRPIAGESPAADPVVQPAPQPATQSSKE